MALLITLFFICFGLALYTFLLYPALMWLVVKFARPQLAAYEAQFNNPGSSSGVLTPTVTVVIAAHNEEQHIATTIKSILNQTYARDKTKIIVFSDGSTDRTEKIVMEYQRQGVELISFKENHGKTECQNRVAAKVKTDLIAFVDGNCIWQKDALENLIRSLHHNQAVMSTGQLNLTKQDLALLKTELSTNKSVSGQFKNTIDVSDEGLFRKMDHQIKKGESILGATIGVDGPIYLIRTTEYISLAPHMVSDLVLPMLVAAQNKKIIFVPEAQAFERSSQNVWQEFVRKRRMINQGLVALPTLLRAASPSRNIKLFFKLVSHKILRWFGFELLAIAFVASLFLWALPAFKVIVIIELVALGLAGLTILVNHLGKQLGPLQPLGYFVLTNFASAAAKIDFMAGKKAITWQSKKIS